MVACIPTEVNTSNHGTTLPASRKRTIPGINSIFISSCNPQPGSNITWVSIKQAKLTLFRNRWPLQQTPELLQRNNLLSTWLKKIFYVKATLLFSVRISWTSPIKINVYKAQHCATYIISFNYQCNLILQMREQLKKDQILLCKVPMTICVRDRIWIHINLTSKSMLITISLYYLP